MKIERLGKKGGALVAPFFFCLDVSIFSKQRWEKEAAKINWKKIIVREIICVYFLCDMCYNIVQSVHGP